ncbi:MAG: hypothetical protein RLY19_545, partial [Actinomycetota bacterium]
ESASAVEKIAASTQPEINRKVPAVGVMGLLQTKKSTTVHEHLYPSSVAVFRTGRGFG